MTEGGAGVTSGASPGPLLEILPPELAILTTLDLSDVWPRFAGQVRWRTVADLAGYHRLGGRLASSLEATRDVGAPAALVAELLGHRERAKQRFFTEALPQLEELCAALVAANVRPVLLKGASLILSGVARPGERPLSDLDLLVARSEAKSAQSVLDELGYRTGVSTEIRDQAWRDHYQDAPFSHPDRWLHIDLHWDIQHPRHRARFDVLTMSRTPLELPSGSVIDRFADTDELTHLCLHFWKDREQGRPGALGQLWDIHAAAGRLDPTDWPGLAERARGRGHERTLAAVLAIANLLLGLPIPPGFTTVRELVADERTTSFAIRRVLAPRSQHIQLLMVPPDASYRPVRMATRVLGSLRRPLKHDPGKDSSISDRISARARHTAFVFRCLLRSLATPLQARAEIALDRWAHSLDARNS